MRASTLENNKVFEKDTTMEADFDITVATNADDMLQTLQDMYIKLDVREKHKQIKQEVTAVVDTLVSKYTNDAQLEQAKVVVDMIKRIEANSITTIYKQTMYLEHLIDTIMERIDESYGGSIPDYMVLMQLQNSLINFNQHLLVAIRQLPMTIRNSIQVTLDSFAIQVEEAEETSTGGLIARSGDLLDALENVQRDVVKNNAQIDAMEPEKLPEDWQVSDEALMAAETIEEAKQIEASKAAQIQAEIAKKMSEEDFE